MGRSLLLWLRIEEGRIGTWSALLSLPLARQYDLSSEAEPETLHGTISY